jgi:hypothetical protein
MLRLSRLLAGVGLLVCCALRLGAAPVLTTIQDTLYKADGTPLNGVVIVTWPSFVAADGSKIAAQTLTVAVPSGYFQAALVPTVGASTVVAYSVRINSAGKNESTELWSVPQSSTPLRIQDVMIVETGGIVIGSGGGTVTVSDTTIPITDVVGLSNQLVMRPMMGPAFADSRTAVINATGGIDAAAGNLSDCVHVDGTSGSCGGSGSSAPSAFVDAEVPAGTMNGSNTQFTLAATPVSASSVAVWRNGLFLRSGMDFTVSGTAVTFVGNSTPLAGDTILASYRTVAVPGVSFVDAETLTGMLDGFNAIFTLTNLPNPASSLAVYRNGLRMQAGVDYLPAGSTITFLPGQVPQIGDTLVCSYRQ